MLDRTRQIPYYRSRSSTTASRIRALIRRRNIQLPNSAKQNSKQESNQDFKMTTSVATAAAVADVGSPFSLIRDSW